MADFGSSHPLFGGSRIVPASEIQAELEIELSQLNPPILQGWLIGVALVCGAVFLGAFAALGFQKAGTSPGAAPAALILAPVVLLAAALIGGLFEREVELQANTVAIRRWTEVWFRRPGIHLAHRVGVRATPVGPSWLLLESGDQVVSVSMAFWPPTVREEVKATLHGWGVELEEDDDG